MRRYLPVFVTVAALCAYVFPASAVMTTIGDGDDVPGRYTLDIKRAASGPDRNGRRVHTITTYRPWDKHDLILPDRYFALAFDTDGDATDIERVMYLFFGDGMFRGVMVRKDGKQVGTVKARQTDPKTLGVTFSDELLGANIVEYRWYALAHFKNGKDCCTDTAPNRRWVHADAEPPAIGQLSYGFEDGGDTVPSGDVTVHGAASDLGGAGIAGWDVLGRPQDAPTWFTAGHGTTEAIDASFTGVEGTTYDLCARARDADGYRVRTDRYHVPIPYDDGGPAFAFSSGWNTAGAQASDYEGTRHTTSTTGASVTITFQSAGVVRLVVPGINTGTIAIDINGSNGGSVYSADAADAPRQLVGMSAVTPLNLIDGGANTLTLTLVSGSFTIDGLAVIAQTPPPPPLGEQFPCG